jgi:hypothetical protein
MPEREGEDKRRRSTDFCQSQLSLQFHILTRDPLFSSWQATIADVASAVFEAKALKKNYIQRR